MSVPGTVIITYKIGSPSLVNRDLFSLV